MRKHDQRTCTNKLVTAIVHRIASFIVLYLLGCHLYRYFFDYGNYTLDFTGCVAVILLDCACSCSLVVCSDHR